MTGEHSLQKRTGSAPSSVNLYDYGNGIFSVQIAAVESNNTLSKDLIEQLLVAIETVTQAASAKVLVLNGTKHSFLSGGRKDYNEAVEQKLYHAITSFPYPVIAAMQGDATGAGFLVGALCDFMICSRTGNYRYSNPLEGLFPTAPEDLLFKERFNKVRATDFLYGSRMSTGKDLQEKGWNCPILSQDQVETYALTLASNLAKKSQDALRLLKQHLARHILNLVKELTTADILASDNHVGSAEKKMDIAFPAKYMDLETHAENVLVIKICMVKKKYGIKAIVADLADILGQVRTSSQYKSIVLVSEHPDFLPGTEQENSAKFAFDFQRLILESPLPVIAVLDSNAKGVSWFMSQFCDASVYHDKGTFCAADICQNSELAKQAAMIFSNRLGNYFGKEILLTGNEYTGIELQQRVGTVHIAKKDQVLAAALELAESWARLPFDTVVSWKKRMALSLQEGINNLPAWLESTAEAMKPHGNGPVPIELNSKVVTATVHPEGILVVKMEDREAKNMFSDAIIQGMNEVFDHIEQTPVYKVVVLTGYDHYFATGGTKETLLAIQKGKSKFTDSKIYQMAMTCKVPVIAAMQGHGIGAGWCLGMFADLILFSEENKYLSPYMNYGFTPGAGATFIMPDRMGYDLARETLLTAQEYAGSALKERGLLIPVLPRDHVYSAAMALAKQIAKCTRSNLTGLKHQLTHHLHKPLEETYALELAMHEKTFVGRSETLERIQNNFTQGGSDSEAETISSEIAIKQTMTNAPSDTNTLSAVTASLKKLLSHELHLHEHEINEDTQFIDLGLDSITGVTWIRKINEKYKTSIEATKVYSYPTLTKLSRYVKEEAEKQGTLFNQSEFNKPIVPVNIPATSQNKIASQFAVKNLTSRRTRSALRLAPDSASTYQVQPIAVIGMAGQFPEAKNLEEFWHNIAQGKNCISEVPQERWDIKTYYSEGNAIPGKTYSKWMGALEEYDLFDPLFFNISPTEAESMDPQQRLFLQACWHSIENAGYNPKTLSGRKCGVFAGCAAGDYLQMSRQHQLSAQGFTGGALSILAARISYFLNLQGPCLSIDTACSSSLVSIANACDSLNSGSSDLALAGGVYVAAGPSMHIMTSQTGMLSPDGRCYSFDQRANGFVQGEGVGVVMVKRLADAQKDRDMILGVIQGWGVNQDGKTNGITAPNPESQARLEQEVYDKFRIDPADIQLIEAHGTGTKLGDPIEVDALKQSFKKYAQKKEYCALGSVKSNIGHCLTAAGVASFIKVLLALKHKQLPPTINFDQLNEHIGLKDSPFYINSRLQEWELTGTERRQAAISAFGFSGTNAHIVVAEYIPPKEVKQPVSVISQNAKIIIPLSAKTAEQLKQKARDLSDFVRKEEQSIDLLEMAYTLQVGREAMGERLGFMVSSLEQLAEKLEAYISGEQHIADTYQGQVKRNKEGMSIISQDDDMKGTIIDNWIAQKKLSKLLDLWVKGLDLDWTKLYGDNKPQRISLPPYPFAKERYWIDPEEPAEVKKGTTISRLHPLLHTNTSNFSRQSYSSTFSGEEFFLDGHRINGQKVLPAGAYLEMARAAVEHATSAKEESTSLELRNIVWKQPISAQENKEVSIALFADDNEQIEYEIYNTEIDAEGRPQEIIHCQGSATFISKVAPVKLAIDQLRTQMVNGRSDAASVYSALHKIGNNYGESFQGLTAVYNGANQLLAKLSVPFAAGSDQSDYYLHPSSIDSALHACIALITDLNKPLVRPLQPVALDALTIESACTNELYAWVRYSDGIPAKNTIPKLDIDLCDQHGNICVTMKGLELSYVNDLPAVLSATVSKAEITEPSWDKMSYICKWEEQAALPRNCPADHKVVLIICCDSTFRFESTILNHYEQNKNCKTFLIRLADKTEQVSEKEWLCGIQDTEGFQTCLQKIDMIDALYFLAMTEQQSDSLPLKELTNSQEGDVIQLLRLAKCLKRNNMIREKIDSYILTIDNYSIDHQPNRSLGGGVTGLGYSLAQGNYQFLVRNLDLSSEDLKRSEDQKNLFTAVYHEPPTGRGEVFKIQSGKRYRQTFFKLNWDTTSSPSLRQNGTYLIVGGSGKVGQIITRNLIQKYSATVVWIGRSAPNSEKVRTALQLFKEFGEKILYIQADVKNRNAMQQAVELIKKKYNKIHGAIFGGMVFDFENSIDQTTEAEFRSILDVKTQGSQIFYTALEKEPLDFMCYFSSGQAYSFSGASKLSAYASGITFADSFVQSFQKISAFPVGIINWGFWKSAVKEITERSEGVSTENLGALEDQEGFGCFERFVNELKQNRIHQVLCMKVSRQMESLMNCNQEEFITLTKWQTPYSALSLEKAIDVPREKILHLKHTQKKDELEEWFTQLLYCQVYSLIKAGGPCAPQSALDLQKQCKIVDKYFPWWNECLNMLLEKQYIQVENNVICNWKTVDTKVIWDAWQIQKEKYYQDPEYKALTVLVNDCLEKLPEILQGQTLATDVIFPNSSMDKVEGVYKNNTLGDTFNEVVANAVEAYLQQRIQSDPETSLRILEIGAGTGGTSAVVFSKLRPFRKSVEKYSYTDLSKAFFFHAEKNYFPDNPYIQCQRLDIEQPIEGQGIEIGSYDLVIATNVLHATRNIRQTLRNAKAVLRQNGFLILNEMSGKSLSAHLTFGLLDGWWLFEDPDLRIPNCPGLYPATWLQVLEKEGFSAVFFPIKEAHGLGQQIILAQSDGIVRQKKQIKEETLPIPTHAQSVIARKSKDQLQKPNTAQRSQSIEQIIQTAILDCLSGTLKIASENIDPYIAFSDYGIDSILGVNFIEEINKRLSLALNTAIIFEYSTLDRLSKHVMKSYRGQIETQMNKQPAVSELPSEESQTVFQKKEPNKDRNFTRRRLIARDEASDKQIRRPETKISEIAVIGMSGKFPKAENINEFCRNLMQGIDGVEELPANYLDQNAYYSPEKQAGKTRCKWGGILRERNCFDPLFFKISPVEAESMNPHQRLVLQESWKSIEDAGYNPKDLSGSQTGVFIGSEPTGYIGKSFTGLSDAIIASRLSYVLNLNGPALVVNTGCSSAGVALHLACESLRNKETNLALAGGVNACMDHNTQVRLDEIEMLSPSGRCFTFDNAGDGTIISEGIGIVVLKRLDDAIVSGDSIYGVICGSGINQDGASNGITAPNGAAQEQLMTNVYRQFQINPEKISYVEAHGTGTKLGDPVEANALVRAFKKFTDKKGYCSVGSAKSHIGHSGAAAAVTGLIKILLAMKHKRIPQLLNFKTLNPLIEFKDSPFYINTQLAEWKSPENTPRMAALNSFGHSGTNAHLVIKEYLSPAKGAQQCIIKTSGTAIIPLSAKTIEQLRQKAHDLLDFIRESEGQSIMPCRSIDLMAMAYTLQVGREAMEERLGFIVKSVGQLAEKLQAYINGEQKIENTYQGTVRRKSEGMSIINQDDDMKEVVEKWITDNKLSKLLDLWVKGLELDWEKLYRDIKPRRISLPTYPFAKERYWIDSPDINQVSDNAFQITENFESIEDIINKIDNDSIDTNQAVRLLKNLA